MSTTITFFVKNGEAFSLCRSVGVPRVGETVWLPDRAPRFDESLGAQFVSNLNEYLVEDVHWALRYVMADAKWDYKTIQLPVGEVEAQVMVNRVKRVDKS